MSALERISSLRWLLILSVLPALILLGQAFYTYAQNLPSLFGQVAEEVPKIPAPPSLVLSSEVPKPTTSAQSLWIYDQRSGSLLYEENAEVATAVASLTKLMTTLIVRENYPLEKPIKIGSASAALGNRAKFLSRDVFTTSDLLQAMLLFSANDAALAFQAADAESSEKFIDRMNEKAQKLNLHETKFINSTGLDHPDQHSSARDIGRISLEVLKDPFVATVAAQEQTIIRELTTNRRDIMYATNVLLRRGGKFTGLKTGTTDLAGECLVLRVQTVKAAAAPSAATSEAEPLGEQVDLPLDLIIVILGSQDRYADALALTRWVEQAVQHNPLLR